MEERYGKKTWLGNKSNTLVLLLAMLVIIFCIFTFLHLSIRLTNEDKVYANSTYEGMLKWFTLPAGFNVLLTRPWTLITYMFTHDDVFHLIGNMIWLWIFGFILQDLAGNKPIFPLFIYGGLCGGVLYLLGSNFVPGLKVPAETPLLGASAGIMAIAISSTLLAPNYRIFPMIYGGIPLWVITVIYLIIDFAMIARDDNAGGHVSHIGGAIFGLLYMWQLKKGNDWSIGMNRFFTWFNDLFRPKQKEMLKPPRTEYFYNTGNTTPYKKVPNLTQKRIDAILDKIGEKGYQQLTDEEKQILKRAAEDENL